MNRVLVLERMVGRGSSRLAVPLAAITSIEEQSDDTCLVNGYCVKDGFDAIIKAFDQTFTPGEDDQ